MSKPITRLEPKLREMPINEFEAETYEEWCLAEVKRAGGRFVYYEELRKGVHWCRVDAVGK